MSPGHLPDRSIAKQITTTPPQHHRRLTRRVFVWSAYIGLFLLVLNLWGNWLSLPSAHAAPPPTILKGAPSTPNRISPAAGASSQTHSPVSASPGSAKAGTPQVIAHSTQMPMKAGSVALQTGQATSFLGSDGKLELRIPAGAITAQDVAQAGGNITLRVTQVAPASGSNAGGSGTISLGSYLIQLVDAHGNLLPHGLRKPLTALYHLGAKEPGLDLEHAHLLLNGSLSVGALKMNGVVQPQAGQTLSNTLGTPQIASTSLDLSARTLTATPLASSPSTAMSWDSDSPVATFGKPDPTSVNLSSGSLSYRSPIDIPAGPGGLTPPVNLTYSSESVNGQHNASAAAGWVGEGWSLSMGQVSWSEHDVLAGCSTCSAEWENEWNLSDPYGTSSQLIPPNINVSTFYDDTPNFYCATGNSASYPCPIPWHTATESHDKIYAYVGPLNINQGINPPCFRVWLPNGLMEEFGCTSDSLQYYLEAGVGALISAWNLDMITDPQGNQIHFSYQQDVQSWTSPTTGHTFTYARDEQLSSISYDSPGCHNAQAMCTGSSWAPLTQVVFNASHAPSILTGTAPTGCNTGTSLRCDNPLDLTSSGGVAAPMLQNTFILNSIQVQVRTSGSGSWNTLRTYKLGYEQSGPSTITDPASSLKRSIAGLLDLTQITEVGSDGTTALPTVNLAYTNLTSYYEDAFDLPVPTTNCGPAWNTGSGSGGCPLWSQSYTNNSRFLSSISNGQGLAQTFSWKIAHNNSHGVPGGGSNNANPFYCDSSQSGYPCNEADDMGWSHAVLTQESSTTIRLTQNGQGDQQSSTPVTQTTNYNYQLAYPLTAQQCGDCVAGMYWGNQNDGDFLNYYNAVFMGFAQATVDLPSGAVEVHHYYAGEGWGIYDTGKVNCFSTSPCHNDPWWDLTNAAHGQEYQAQYYDIDGTTLLKQVNTTFSATCPPGGVSGTPASSNFGNWDSNLVSSLDHNNPVVVCSVLQAQQTSQIFNGASSSVSTSTSWTYDNYGRVTQQKTTGNSGTPGTVVTNTAYVWNDNVTATQSSATGTYLIDTKAFSSTEDGTGNRLGCTYTSYDGQGYLTGQTTALTAGQATTETKYANCGTSANGYTPGGPSTTTTAYDAYGNAIGTNDADANGGISGHTGCTVSSVQHTSCTTYDSTFEVYPITTGNALNQTSNTSYANTGALFGFGTWPTSSTDANGQTTSTIYDALGRITGETLPGETSGVLTRQWVYTFWCSGTAAQSPCEETDEIDRINSSTTITTRAFYDGEGRLVETRAPGFNGQDVVVYAYYDTAGRQIFKSNPYFVTAYTGAPGAAAYSIPDSTQPGTSTSYPNLRTSSATDPNSHTNTTTASVVCGVSGTSDTGCYVQSMAVDAIGHQSATLTGGLGKTNYTQIYTGSSGSYALYATTTYIYDPAGNLLSTVSPDGSKTASVYDDLGHVTSQSDPDRGTTTLGYDPNGNLIQSVDARGSTGTLYIGYDGLSRPVWQNSTNTSTGALVTYNYDGTTNGNRGIGHLTGESFTGSGGLSGSYAFTFDGRGQQTGETVVINGTSYPVQITYNDNGQMTSETYPTGEVVTPGYSSTGWLVSLSTQTGSTVTTLASNLAYSGLAGAAGKITAMGYGNGANYTASYDTGLRLTSASLTQTSTNAVIYSTQPAYDAANNVVSVQTSISDATDTQQFCYDSLNRLTWSGTSGTPPCSGVNFSGGTLTGASYQQSDSYNAENGLVTGPAGSYTYGNSSHPHAVTATGNGYSAAYDAVGNLICRAPSSATTCSGTQTGQQLGYDPQGRLSTWQNQPGTPGSTANYLYDGAGNRVAMQTTANGTTTLTAYIGSIEEVQTTGGSSTTTTYYAVGGTRIAAKVNGALDYFGYDALGSQVVVLNNSGNLAGSQLYGPYGNSRYSAGTLPTSIGFTGQRSDSVTGLDYYNARYYDPAVGQFLSADLKQGNAQGMDPYAYVGGNPETRTDPTGQRYTDGNGNTAIISNGNAYINLSNGTTKVVKLKNPSQSSPTPPKNPGSSGGKGPNTTASGNDQCPDSDCIAEKDAQQVARDGANFFNGVASNLNKIEAFLSSFYPALLLAAFFAGIASGIVAGIIQAISSLAQIAQDIANGFTDEANHPLTWFTEQNVSNDTGSILGPVLGDVGKDIGLGVVGELLGLAIGGIGAAIGSDNVFQAGLAVIVGAATYNTVVADGSAVMAGSAFFQYIIPQENTLDTVLGDPAVNSSSGPTVSGHGPF